MSFNNQINNTAIKLKPISRALFFLLFIIFGLWMVHNVIQPIICLFAILIFLIFLRKPHFIIYLIILTFFFEDYIFSFYLFNARVRVHQLIAVLGIIAYLPYIIVHRDKILAIPIYTPLLVFVYLNFLSIYNAPNPEVVFKECLLLLSNILIFFLIIQILNDSSIFKRSFRLLLGVGILQGCYGIYQFLCGVFSYYLGLNLPVTKLKISTAYLGSVFGRPYGTFAGVGWLAAVMMFYFFLFFFLYSNQKEKKENFYRLGIIISVVVVLICLSRAAYIGLLGGLLVSIFFLRTTSQRLISKKMLFKGILLALSFIMVLLIFFSPLYDSTINRLSSTKNLLSEPRVVQMIHSYQLFKKHPIIGTGPGSFSELGIYGSSSAQGENIYWKYYEQTTGLKPWNISLISSIFIDVGISGFIVFIWLAFSYIKFIYRSIPMITDLYFQRVSFGLLIGIISLFISYLFSNGFWIPFTWVFLGFSVAAVRLGLRSK